MSPNKTETHRQRWATTAMIRAELFFTCLVLGTRSPVLWFLRAGSRVACAVAVAPVEQRAPRVASNTMATQHRKRRQEGQWQNTGGGRHILRVWQLYRWFLQILSISLWYTAPRYENVLFCCSNLASSSWEFRGRHSLCLLLEYRRCALVHFTYPLQESASVCSLW